MFARLFCLGVVFGVGLTALPEAKAQSRDVSPHILLESVPSDNANYRRMIYVHYMSGSRVTVSYAAYNRTEFKQVQARPTPEAIQSCATGAATSLSDIDAFERSEKSRTRSGQTPEVNRFCIKNVPSWESGNKKRYLDPIFNGLPYSANKS